MKTFLTKDCTALVDHLHAVADAEHGQPQPEYLGVVGGRVVGVHALGAARDDDGGELVVLLDVVGRDYDFN